MRAGGSDLALLGSSVLPSSGADVPACALSVPSLGGSAGTETSVGADCCAFVSLVCGLTGPAARASAVGVAAADAAVVAGIAGVALIAGVAVGAGAAAVVAALGAASLPVACGAVSALASLGVFTGSAAGTTAVRAIGALPPAGGSIVAARLTVTGTTTATAICTETRSGCADSVLATGASAAAASVALSGARV